jgi:hypothetical protein
MSVAVNLQTVHPRKLAAVRSEVALGAVGSAWGSALGKVWEFIRTQPGLRTDGHNVFLYHHPTQPGAPIMLRTALKNKINNILSARGLNLAKEALGSEKKLNEVLELPFDEIVRIELRVIVEQIRSLNKGIAELENTIGEAASKLRPE